MTTSLAGVSSLRMRAPSSSTVKAFCACTLLTVAMAKPAAITSGQHDLNMLINPLCLNDLFIMFGDALRWVILHQNILKDQLTRTKNRRGKGKMERFTKIGR